MFGSVILALILSNELKLAAVFSKNRGFYRGKDKKCQIAIEDNGINIGAIDAKEAPMAFKAELLKKKLKEENKTRDELVEDLKKQGCLRHKRTVSRWLAGTNPPKPKDLEAIARALHCKPQDFDPFFADIGLGEVSIQAHVSTASHNAYELMRWRYGVSQKQIMELAPVLFSIVAGHALKVPEQDAEVAYLAIENGLSDPRLDEDRKLGDQAIKLKKCFGIETSCPRTETSRNLFYEAIIRLSAQISNHVDTKWFVKAAAEVPPSAAGYISDVDYVELLSGGEPQLAEAISKGRIRLSSVVQQVNETKGNGRSVEELAEAIRKAHEQGIETQRKEGLKKLKVWRAFYAERHPEMAAEYDDLVAKHCHEEGWYPERYTGDDRVQSWVNPFQEDLHLNEDTLSEYSSRKAAALEAGEIAGLLPDDDPIYRRFEELQRHRSKLKKQFEEEWA
ncbi:helix-turn-helix domain-containing protein [Sagittula sp. SSi028]|uniref:helix-turn-helix domain-containing protein n=1 Tax=Sagittula sp. SSi028 TaxID=3400636 RepID=UPI003AF945FE